MWHTLATLIWAISLLLSPCVCGQTIFGTLSCGDDSATWAEGLAAEYTTLPHTSFLSKADASRASQDVVSSLDNASASALITDCPSAVLLATVASSLPVLSISDDLLLPAIIPEVPNLASILPLQPKYLSSAIQRLIAEYGWQHVGILDDGTLTEAASISSALAQTGVTVQQLGNADAGTEINKRGLGVLVLLTRSARSTALWLVQAQRAGLLTQRQAYIVITEPDFNAVDDVVPVAERIDSTSAYGELETALEVAPAGILGDTATAVYALDSALLVSSLPNTAQGVTGPLALDADGFRGTIDYDVRLPNGTKVASISEVAVSVLLDTTSNVVDLQLTEVVVGFVVSRSGADRGFVSQERELAARAVTEMLNEGQSSVKLSLVVIDRANLDCAVVAQEFVERDVAVVIGPGSSSCAIDMHSVLVAAGIPHVGFSETAARLSDKAEFPLFFRIAPSDTFQGLVLAELARDFGWSKIGTIGTNDAYGDGLANAFEASFSQNQGTVSASQRFSPTEPDPADFVKTVLEGGSAVNLISADQLNAQRIMEAARLAGSTGPGWTWLGADASSGLDLSLFLARAMKGQVGLQPRSGTGPIWEKFIQFGGSDQWARFVSAASSRLRYIPHVHDAFMAVQLAALRQSNSPGPIRDRLVEGLRSLNSPDTGFLGAIGSSVFFDEAQDGPVLYDLVNLQEPVTNQFVWELVGSFDNGTLQRVSPIVWSDSTTDIPSDEPPLVGLAMQGDDDSNTALLAGLLVPALLLLIGFFAYVIYQRKVVKQLKRREHIGLYPLPDKWEVPVKSVKQLEQIGEGAFGVVYRGIITQYSQQRMMRDSVAVKMLKDEADLTDKFKFVDEATLMKRLMSMKPHPNVVGLVGVTLQREPFRIITEFCENGDLRSFLRNQVLVMEGPELTFDKQLELARMAADGMAFLGDAGVVHGDLAARNCLVTADLVLKVSDFGSSKSLQAQGLEYYRTTGTAFLPVRWLPAECFTAGLFTSETDRWSYGILFWEMITWAQLPYPDMTNQEVVESILGGYRMPCPTGCPNTIYNIMLKCWAKDPAERMPFEEIRAELDEILDVLLHRTKSKESLKRFQSIVETSRRLSASSITPKPRKPLSLHGAGGLMLKHDSDGAEKEAKPASNYASVSSWNQGTRRDSRIEFAIDEVSTVFFEDSDDVGLIVEDSASLHETSAV